MKASKNSIELIKNFDDGQTKILSKENLNNLEKIIDECIFVELNQHQFDALISFCSSVTVEQFKNSNFVKRINLNEEINAVAAEELPQWNKNNEKISQILTRRRLAELELFCSNPPKLRFDHIDITTITNTCLTKRLPLFFELNQSERANVYKGRTFRDCTVIDRENKYSFVNFGQEFGKWWICNTHWEGLETKTIVRPYATESDLKYLRSFPYFYQDPKDFKDRPTNEFIGIAMCLKYLDIPNINNPRDYLNLVNKPDGCTFREAHLEALAKLRVTAKFIKFADEHDIKKQIELGSPVVVSILSNGDSCAPTSGGHFVVIIGYGNDYWLVHDPRGRLDLINGGCESTESTAGRSIKYKFDLVNPRIFSGGGGSGWCWYNFKHLR